MSRTGEGTTQGAWTIDGLATDRAYNGWVGVIIDTERRIQRLTVDQLAKESGVPRRTLYHLISGERDIDLLQLWKIAPVLHKRPSDLLAEAERRMVESAQYQAQVRRTSPSTGNGPTTPGDGHLDRIGLWLDHPDRDPELVRRLDEVGATRRWPTDNVLANAVRDTRREELQRELAANSAARNDREVSAAVPRKQPRGRR